MRWRRPVSVTICLLVAMGCGGNSHQGAAGNADAASDAAPSTDAFSGRRAYIVTATLTGPPTQGLIIDGGRVE